MTKNELVIDMRILIDDIRQRVNDGQCVILKGEGVSMVPFITDADVLTLRKPIHKKPKIGEIYLYKRDDGTYAIHRVYAVKKERVFMLGDAQLFIEEVPLNDLVAVVFTVTRPNETVDCSDPTVRRRGAVGMKRRVAKAKIRRAFHGVLRNAGRVLGAVKKLIKKER